MYTTQKFLRKEEKKKKENRTWKWTYNIARRKITCFQTKTVEITLSIYNEILVNYDVISWKMSIWVANGKQEAKRRKQNVSSSFSCGLHIAWACLENITAGFDTTHEVKDPPKNGLFVL